jgi:hypothetical protein
VVQTNLHGQLRRALRAFHDEWVAEFEAFQARRQRELEELEERQRRKLQAFNEALQRISREVKPPGAPHKRAGIFG